MDKVKLEFKAPRSKTIEYNGVEIVVDTFLTTPKQIFLIDNYLEDYFAGYEEVSEDVKHPYLKAEYSMINYIMQLNTNIDYENIDINLYSDEQFWFTITSEITNYYNFREKLNTIVEEKKRRILVENSIGKVALELVDKAYGLLENFSEITPEEIEKLQKIGLELADKMESSSLLSDKTEKKE